MKKINFVNNEAPYLNAENLNQMQNNMEDATHRDITSGGNPVKCGYKVDGKDVYVIKRTLNTGTHSQWNDVNLGITNCKIIKVVGTLLSGGYDYVLPYYESTDVNASLTIYNNTTLKEKHSHVFSTSTLNLLVYFTYNE